MIEVIQFPCLSDNYGYLIHNSETNYTISIDSPDGDEIIAQAKKNKLKINAVWNTHHHFDHVGGNDKIRAEFNAKIIAPKEVKDRGHYVDEIIDENSIISLGGIEPQIIDLSGHTFGQLGFYFKDHNIAFIADALFSLGCGRLFEGDAKMAYNSLQRLLLLNDATHIYCAHEYSLANAQFCESLNLRNDNLDRRIKEIRELRSQNLPTIPFSLGQERFANPFLLHNQDAIREALGAQYRDSELFGYIRKLKDNFKT